MRLAILTVVFAGSIVTGCATSPPTPVDDAKLKPVDQLLSWLNVRSQAEDVIRVPVVIRHPKDALGWGHATLSADPADAHALKLDLDDGRLGISLDSRVRALCPPPAEVCTLWLEGVFGRTLPGPATLPGPDADGAWPFTVHIVGDLVTDPANARATLAPRSAPHRGLIKGAPR